MSSLLKQAMDKRGLRQRDLSKTPNYYLASKHYTGERRVSLMYCIHYFKIFGISPKELRPDVPWDVLQNSDTNHNEEKNSTLVH